MAEQALTGLKVIEWGSFIAAPFCTELLAQLGAEVIKIEPPAIGDESRSYGPFLNDVSNLEKSGLFLYLNLDKFGITLDPTKPKGKEILLKLLAETDVFVVNQPQFDLQKLGLDWETLKKSFPRLVMCIITPFGYTGPYKNWKGHDLNSCALGGITSTIGYPERVPINPPLYQGHHQAGLMAANAIMISILNRDKSGEGSFIDQSEADVWATIHIGMGIQSYLEEGRVRTRTGHFSAHRPYPDTVLPCKDGAVCLDAPQNRQWKRLLEAMGNPEWGNSSIFQDRILTTDEHWQEADAYLKSWLMQRTKAEIFKIMSEAKVPCAPIRTVDEVINDEHMKQRGFFNSIDSPNAGNIKSYPGVCYKFSKTPYTPRRPAPSIGEHNQSIYLKLGYSLNDLETMILQGVI